MRKVSHICKVLIAALVACVALGAFPASGQASASGAGLLVFRSDRDGEPDLFTLDVMSSSTTKLTVSPGFAELQPAWSPEGDRIAYIRRPLPKGRTDLFVMNANGKHRMRLTNSAPVERDPSWSPDGTMLVYAARTSSNGPFRVFEINADGSGGTQLTSQSAGSADRAPVFSPDGSKIAFVSDRARGFPELYVMDANGTGVRRLTNNSRIEGNPSWSPDGTRLAFEGCCINGTSDIFTIDVLSRAETNLTDSTTRQEFDPSWSSDGTLIAFVAFDIGQGNIDLWMMNADGTSPMSLTQQAGPDLSPDWQP